MAVDSERYPEDTSAYISGERARIIPDASRTVAEATGSPLYQSQLSVVLVCHTKHNPRVIVTKAAKEDAFRHRCESELLNKEV